MRNNPLNNKDEIQFRLVHERAYLLARSAVCAMRTSRHFLAPKMTRTWFDSIEQIDNWDDLEVFIQTLGFIDIADFVEDISHVHNTNIMAILKP